MTTIEVLKESLKALKEAKKYFVEYDPEDPNWTFKTAIVILNFNTAILKGEKVVRELEASHAS